MSSESPAVISYSSLGIEISVPNGSAVSSSAQPGLMIDGYNYATGLAQLLAVDSSGHSIVVGAGVAGTPAGGVVSVQGVSGGTALTVNNATAANLLANVGGLGAAGSAPSGNPVYIGASVTTAAPTYTTGTMNALSLTTAGLLRVDGTGGTFPISGTITVNAGTGNFNNASVSTTASAPPASATYIGGSVTTAAPTYTTGQMDPLSLTTAGALRVDGSGVTQPVSITGTISTVTDKSATGTMTTVAGSASSATLLASNANRLGASFYNDSTSILFIALSATAASNTAFTIRLLPNSYFDMPVTYTGQVNGIWTTATGNARVTEWT